MKNFALRHGSIRGFFDSLGADIVCFQVCHSFMLGLSFLWTAADSADSCSLDLTQETKLMEEKLSKELVCVEGYEVYYVLLFI